MKNDLRPGQSQNDWAWIMLGLVIAALVAGSWLLGLPLIDPCFHLCG